MLAESEQIHAPFSPSSLEKMEQCPGYRKRVDPEGKRGLAADIGTKIHAALESGKLDLLPDEDSKSMARQCVDYIEALLTEQLPKLPTQDFRERKIAIDLGGDLKTWGHLDRLIIFGQKGHVFDFKTGKWPVTDADTNIQLWSYVLGAFQAHPELESITGHILCPQRNEVSVHEFLRPFITELKLRVNTVIRRAMDENPETFRPAAGLCEWCARQTTCVALGKKLTAVATKLAPMLTIPESVTVSKDRLQDIPRLLQLAPLLEGAAKGIREEALRLNLEEGVQIPGYQRISRALPRAVTSVLGAYEAVKDKMGLNVFLAACSKVSVVDLEDYFADQAKTHGKGKARQDLEDRLKAAGVLREKSETFYLKKSIDKTDPNVIK